MKAEMKLLKILQPGEEFHLLVRVEATACARIPDRPRQVQFLKPDKPADLFQVLRLDQRPNQINTDDMNLARGQLRDIPDGLASAFKDDAATLADHPLATSRSGARAVAFVKTPSNSVTLRMALNTAYFAWMKRKTNRRGSRGTQSLELSANLCAPLRPLRLTSARPTENCRRLLKRRLFIVGLFTFIFSSKKRRHITFALARTKSRPVARRCAVRLRERSCR